MTSVLASLTAEVMADKKSEARKLTPVEGEKGALPLEQAHIPNDTGKFMSNELLHDSAKQLRQWATDYIAIADGLDALLEESSTPEEKVEKVDPRFAGSDPEPLHTEIIALGGVEDPEKPMTGETDFAADFAAKAAAAKAATFRQPIQNGVPGATVGEPDEWVCPIHNKPGVEKTSNKTGKTFVGCPDCNSFKR